MSRIEDTLTQDEIGNSLLGEPAPESAPAEEPQGMFSVSGADLLDEAVEEQGYDVVRFGDKVIPLRQQRDEQTTEQPRRQAPDQQQENNEAWRPQNQPVDPWIEQEAARRSTEQSQQAQPQQPLTPEQFAEGLKQADTFIERSNLNEGSEKFSADLSQQTGISYDNCKSFSHGFSRAFMSARGDYLSTEGNVAKLRPLGEMEVQHTNKLIGDFFGINLQMNPPAYPEMVPNALRLGLYNLIDTIVKNPQITDVQQLNNKQMCVWLCQAIEKGLYGTESPTNEAKAVQFVNLIAQRVMDMIPKARAGAPAARQARRQGGQRAAMRMIAPKYTPPKMRTNKDVFTPETLEAMNTRL